MKDWVEAQKRKRINIERMDDLPGQPETARGRGRTGGSRADVKYGNQILQDVNIRGVTANMVNIGTEQVAVGRFITEGDYQRRTCQ